MELNTKGRYAVMALADLAKFGGAGAVPLSAVAERQKLSLSYLEQIFLRLRRANIVESARGRAGGYKLSRSASKISIAEILRAVEEETRMTRCMGDPAGGCMDGSKCLTHELWHALGWHIESFLEAVSLQEVLDGVSLPKPMSRAVSANDRAHSDWVQE